MAQKPAFGVAGWTKNDDSILIYDKFDIWQVAADGSKATRLIDGAGEQVRHRYVRINPDEEFIDVDKPLMVALFGTWSKRPATAASMPGRRRSSGWSSKTDRSPVWGKQRKQMSSPTWRSGLMIRLTSSSPAAASGMPKGDNDKSIHVEVRVGPVNGLTFLEREQELKRAKARRVPSWEPEAVSWKLFAPSRSALRPAAASAHLPLHRGVCN
ncbi:hypothetical protein BH18ACI5_BH18ACI5_03340 [soil metagenome]